MFNKDTGLKFSEIILPNYFYFDLIEWVNYEDMTEEEKDKYQYAKDTEGYLKVYEYKEAWKKSFEKANVKEIQQTIELPNFDYAIFEEISGITKEMIQSRLNLKDKDCSGKVVVIDSKKYELKLKE